jgi:hypothetical protein
MLRRVVVMLLLGFGAGQPASAAQSEAPLRVLFVGNSLTYTNNLPAVVEQLGALPGGHPIRTGTVAFPNFSVADHLGRGDAASQIRGGDWDVVVLQQGPSGLPASRMELVASTRRFVVLTRAAGMRLALLGVWPASDRPTAFDSVTASYAAAAEAAGGLLLPAGRAWMLAWRIQPLLALYGADGFHPGPMGTLLAALVVYQGLTGHVLTALPSTLVIDGVTLRLSPNVTSILLKASREALPGSGG